MAPAATGMDPAAAAMDPAAMGAATGGLPSLTGGSDPTAAAATAGMDPSMMGGSTDAAAAGATAGTTDPAAAGGGGSGLLGLGTWLGPLMTIGGGAAALWAFSKGQDGSKFAKIAGIGGAGLGLGITGLSFKAKGAEEGAKATEAEALAAMQRLQAQYMTTMQQVTDEATAQVSALQQQLAAGGGAQDPAAAAAASAPIGEDPVAGATAGDAASAADPSGGVATLPDGTMPAGQDSAAWGDTTVVPQAATGPVEGTPAEAFLGRSITLQAGSTSSGTEIAEAGTFVLEQAAGDPNGYATLEEANAAARETMSTELMGSKYLRWVVVEQGGKFYGAIAKQAEPGSTAQPLSSDVGTVVGWSAMNHVSEGGATGWQAYEWTKDGGAKAKAVPYESTSVFGDTAGGGAGTSGDGSVVGGGPAAPTGTAPATKAGGSSTSTFDPSSAIGHTFDVNDATTSDGGQAAGGTLQVQQLAGDEAGYATAEEAAAAARQARSQGGGDKWSRWITLQGDDGRHYVYEGSVVARATKGLEGAAPVHVFGDGFAEYYDGASSAWTAVADA